MLTHPLLNLASFTNEHPPKDLGEGAWREKARHELHLQPGVRMHITIEQAADLGYGLWRDEELADAGLYAADYDSIAFAQQLTAVLSPQLSLQNLQHLVAVLTQALAAEEGACAVRRAGGNPSAPGRPDSQAAMLERLAQDIERHPERLNPLDAALQARLLALVAPDTGVGDDLKLALGPEVPPNA